jgi:triosephosphate isomerase
METRKKIAAGNWKMNLNVSAAHELFQGIAAAYDTLGLDEHKQVILAPPFVYLEQMAIRAEEYPFLHLCAQNCHQEDKGAYTGEISAAMLAALGVDYVLVGHSERRIFFNEDHRLLSQKVDAALRNGLIPIFCCGEPLEVREANDHFNLVQKQLEESLWHLSSMDKVIIAYEPVWAIGTGRTASSDQAQEMHAFIRKLVGGRYGLQTAESLTILYGGSCNANNAPTLFSQPDVDGGLVGGASLKAEEFVQIIQSLQ